MPKRKENLLNDFLTFFKEFSKYLYKRVRLVFVLSTVFYEVVSQWTSGLKRYSLRYLFWGRVKGYRAVVAAFLTVLVFLLPFIFRRQPITQETYAIEQDAYATFAQNDLLIEQGTSQTLIPKSRPRMDIMIYTVKGGDTVSTIAEEFGLSVDTIVWANNLSSAHVIKPGMQLKILPGDGVIHTVKKGDSLASIAKKYEAAEQAIADVNWLDPPFTLEAGQTLFIPDGTMPPDPTPVASTSTSATGGNVSTGGGSPPPAAPPSGTRFLSWPVAGGRGYVSQCYTGWHNGIDIADPGWPNVVAGASGKVVFAGCQSGSCPPPGSSIGGYGLAWTIIIDHGNGYSTIYGHLNKLYVSSGQYVGTGSAIGQMGRSGTATGVHLHFMVVRSGTWSSLNPAQFMQNHVCGY
ncbi:M23 family metallopeptidase [Candidatus Dojkabacteria bacterium]|nr:M23 family metallopeptidase [Candidatus Dojkabacteria bacterium]